MIESAVGELAVAVGTVDACLAVGRPRATHYRRQRPPAPKPPQERQPQPRALLPDERSGILELLNSERFVDEAPPTVYAKLLDEGRYLGSVSTMYRILRSVEEVRERRRVAVHPAYVKPELIAERPNQVWSWDITKLPGPEKWTWFYLYKIIDIFSRYIPGWMVASCESATLAGQLIAEAVRKQGVDRDQLIMHSDRGPSMASKPVALLLADLGVTKSFSRPHCPNDNPFVEASFKTLKYRPDFPDRFGSAEDARSFCTRFFNWYLYDHRHSGIGYHTPADVHYGRASLLREQRAAVLTAAYVVHPERFVRQPPEPPKLPAAAWINRPIEEVMPTQ